MSPRVPQLISGVGIAGAMFLLAWVIAIGPEDRNPPANRLYAAMRSHRGRRIVAAIIGLCGLTILVLHLVKFLSE
jgi:hypothetical protein